MANNYLQFSESIDDLNDEEIQFLVNALNWEPPYNEEGDLPDNFEWPAWYDVDAESFGFDCDLNKKDRYVHFYAEEYGNIDTLGELVHAFICKFRPELVFHLTFAETCSKMRIGEFGGGALVVSKYGVECMSAHGWVTKKRDELQARLLGEQVAS